VLSIHQRTTKSVAAVATEASMYPEEEGIRPRCVCGAAPALVLKRERALPAKA
jgi:hypothetical protein